MNYRIGLTIPSIVLIAAMFGPAGVHAAPKRAGQSAQQDGTLVGLHALRSERGLVCMAEHTHTGSSTAQPSRKAAELAALRDWASFTAWEYGSHWGNAAIAGSKSFSCSRKGATHACDFEARPCRR